MRGLRRRLGFSVRRRRTRRRFSYRRRRGISQTRSRVVKLTGTVNYVFYTKTGTADGGAQPFSFVPSQLSGFFDYASTYSEFRLLKAQLVIPCDPSNQTDPSVVSIMRVPSRAFVEPTFLNSGSTPGAIVNYQVLPPRAASVLQQSRWAKLVSPSDTRNTVKFGFYPYTLRWSGRPVGTDAQGAAQLPGAMYAEYQSGKRWMSFSFLGNPNNSSQLADDVRFYGPYFMPYGQDGLPTHAPTTDPNPGTVTWTRNVQLTLWCQFRGQR